MTAETTDGPPTDGAIYWSGYMAKRPYKFPYTDLDNDTRDAIEAGAAAVAAAAIARLNQPAELAAALVENVRLRKELHERDALLADALTPTAGDFDQAAEITRLRGISPTAWTTASPLSLTAPPPGLTPVEAVRTAVAEEWQPRVDALRDTVRELLDCTGLDDGEKAEWLERAGIDLEDE